MSEKPEKDTLREDEIEETNGEELPDREALSTIPIADPISGFTLPVDPTE
jgi:hypothetical protein